MNFLLVCAAGMISSVTDTYSSFQMMDAAGDSKKEHEGKGEKRGRPRSKVEVN